jgi:hypothetical protein
VVSAPLELALQDVVRDAERGERAGWDLNAYAAREIPGLRRDAVTSRARSGRGAG